MAKNAPSIPDPTRRNTPAWLAELSKPVEMARLRPRRDHLIIAAMAALVSHVALLLMVEVRTPPPAPVLLPRAYIQLPPEGEGSTSPDLIRLEGDLRDTAPLFFPGPWSTATQYPTDLALQSSPVFGEFPARLLISADEMQPAPVDLPEASLEAQQSRVAPLEAALALFGASESVRRRSLSRHNEPDPSEEVTAGLPAAQEPPVEGFPSSLTLANRLVLEAIPLNDSGLGDPLVWQQALSDLPASGPWSPTLWSVTLEGGSLQGLPYMIRGSGQAEVDLFLRAWLLHPTRLATLPDGSWLLTLGQ